MQPVNTPRTPRWLLPALLLLTAIAGMLWYVTGRQDAGTPGFAVPATSPGIGAPTAAPVGESLEPVPTTTSSAPPAQSAPPAAPVDLAVAIERARAAQGLPPPTATPPVPPPGQTSWQNMTPQEAAKVFEDAVKNKSVSSPASPFRHE